MKFTRFHFIEAIIFILSNTDNKNISVKELFSKLKNKIIFPPDENVLKFQFIITLKNLKNTNMLSINNNQVIFSPNYISPEYNFDNEFYIELEKSNIIFKKILIDLKNNKEIFKKFDQEVILEQLLELIN